MNREVSSHAGSAELELDFAGVSDDIAEQRLDCRIVPLAATAAHAEGTPDRQRGRTGGGTQRRAYGASVGRRVSVGKSLMSQMMRLEVAPDNLDVVEFRRVRLIEIERRRRAGGRPGPDIAVWSVSRGPWAHDVFGNAVATAVFQGASDSLVIDSVVELRLAGSARPVFSIAASAIVYPFRYSDDERFRREVAGAPEIGGEQRCAFGAHGVGRPGGMMQSILPAREAANRSPRNATRHARPEADGALPPRANARDIRCRGRGGEPRRRTPRSRRRRAGRSIRSSRSFVRNARRNRRSHAATLRRLHNWNDALRRRTRLVDGTGIKKIAHPQLRFEGGMPNSAEITICSVG